MGDFLSDLLGELFYGKSTEELSNLTELNLPNMLELTISLQFVFLATIMGKTSFITAYRM